MSSGQDFQLERKEWSRWKHRILIEYLKAMSAILRRWGTIYYIDAFAGPGRYTEDDMDGSPLIAAKHARELDINNEPYQLKCINIERDSEVFSNLQSSTQAFTNYSTNYFGSFGEHVSKILQTVVEYPTLFFLDPIGLKGIEWKYLLPILQRNQHEDDTKTELLIRFDVQTAMRLAGFLDSDVENSESYLQSLREIYGVDTNEFWLHQNVVTVEQKRDALTSAYEDRLRLYMQYVARIPIKTRDDQLKYFLIFCTRSLKGIQVMNDVLHSTDGLRAEIHKQERRERGIATQIPMFEKSDEEKLLDTLNELKEFVVETLRNEHRKVRRDDLRARIALTPNNLGRFSRSHFTAVLGGRASKPKGFESLKDQIVLENSTAGDDKTYIRLK